MNKRLKKIYKENNLDLQFNLEEAVDLAINSSTTKFDETIDICMNLNIDPKNGEQNVRGTIKLPKSLGKEVKVCVFAKEDKHQEAKDAGADIVGGDELIGRFGHGGRRLLTMSHGAGGSANGQYSQHESAGQ